VESNGEPAARASAAAAGRIVAGIVASGADPRSLGGVDYVAILESFYDPATGSYDGSDLANDLVAANGRLAAVGALPAQALRSVRQRQCRDDSGNLGGFAATDCSSGPDVVTTAWAINVLRRAGMKPSSLAVAGARRFLVSSQNADGGFGATAHTETRASTTGLATSAIYALREDPRDWKRSAGTPLRALATLQDASGGFRDESASPQPDGHSTELAVPALARRTYPVLPPPRSMALPDAGGAADRVADEGSAGGKVGSAEGLRVGPSVDATPDDLSSERKPLRTARPCEVCEVSAGAFARPRVTSTDGVTRTRLTAMGLFGVASAMFYAGYSLLRKTPH
jgi:hypothetical protein